MSEELRIDVQVQSDDSKARKQLDGLIKEYNDKSIDFKIKVDDIDFSGIRSSITRLTSDLNKLTNIKFSELNKLETNLKNINKLMAQQNNISGGSNKDISSNTSDNVRRLVGDQKESLEYIKELDSIGKELDQVVKRYNQNQEDSFKEFAKVNEKALEEINKLSNSSSKSAFKKILAYKEEMESISKEMANLGVAAIPKEKVFELDSGKMGVKKWTEYEDLMGQSAERFEKAVERSKEIVKRQGQLKKNLENNLKQLNDEEKVALRMIEDLHKDLKPVGNVENDYLEKYLKQILESYLSIEDMKGLDFKFSDDIFKGYERFIQSVKDIKKEFNDTFKGEDGFVEFKLFDNVQKAINGLDNTVETVSLDNLKEKLTNAFDIDEKVIANIEKIESALKQLNSMSELTQKSLFEGNNKSGLELELDGKIKEYLAVDKSINDAYTKMSKAELTRNDELVSSLEKEINLLRQKQALIGMDIRGLGADDGLLEQIRLQEQLNRTIRETASIEFKNSYLDKMHTEALKLNQEFDELHKSQKQLSEFELPNMDSGQLLDIKGIKSYVDYLDSAEDGLKRIITQYTNVQGVDLVSTLYGDGTEVKKVVGNIEKATNELTTAYKQADNELTRLLKTQQQMDFKGDKDTVALLDKQIANWRQIKSNVEDTARSVKVYDQMVEKAQSTLDKNKNTLSTNESKIEFQIDLNYQNAARKVQEFQTKTLSNLQELERKYKGTQLYDGVVQEIERLKSELKSLDSYLDSVEKVDMSHLSSEFRRISQDATQVKRDMNDLNKTISNDFFDDLYDSMRTFTLGNMIGDAIQNAASGIKDAVVGLDNAMRDMMKVAPASFQGTSDQLNQVKFDAIDVAKSVGKSTEDVIQGMSKALQTGAKNMSEALEIAKASATFANVGDLDQGTADTYVASIMSGFYGMDNALKPVRQQVQGMGQDYNNLTNFLDQANYAG